jgi:aerobic-type carbon monoxide dehydrogenase small subunit (CoxS/CutS family)
MMAMARFELLVNGRRRVVNAAPGTTLVSVLRDTLGLTGAKLGCGEGQCGTCTVLLGGQAVRACITAIEEVKNQPVVTIEGLERRGKLHPVQQAFLDAAAFQCGYCTPGMILEAVALLGREPQPGDGVIKQGLEGHICRCGTYPRIVEAVRLAAKGGRRG